MLSIGSHHQTGTIMSDDSPGILIVHIAASSTQLIMAYAFFRVRRFQHGFPFLLKKNTLVIALLIAGIILLLTTWITAQAESDSYRTIPLYFIGILITGVGIIIGIRRGITLFYRRWAKKHNDELHAKEIAERDRENQRLREKIETLMAANHGINHRLAAAERYLCEIAAEFPGRAGMAEVRAGITRMAGEYNAAIDRVKTANALQTTNVIAIDNLFQHFYAKFREAGIDFNVKVTGSILHMAETAVDQGRLETIIGDHLQNAFHAVEAGGNPVRSVLAMIGAAGDHYEFSVHDSGVPFEPGTLARLGAERVTAAAGGTGIGFMTTFQTMRAHGASLIIREEAPGNPGFTKSVAICFDGRNRYIIETFRPDDIPQSDRYTIVCMDTKQI
jgi:signal transduction histidine kinase